MNSILKKIIEVVWATGITRNWIQNLLVCLQVSFKMIVSSLVE